MSNRWFLLLVAVLLALGAAACGDEDASGGDEHAHDDVTASSGSGAGGEEEEDTPPPFAEGEATTKLEVVLQDYAFVGVPDKVAGPNVWFAASIKGSNTHELEVLDAHGEPIDEIEAFKGADTHTLAVVLEPGTYTLQCLVEEGSRTHAQLGMKKSFTVT